jgi:valyl-tRNA synthetase
MHPFMPFITEELWQRVAPLIRRSGETIMLQTYPEVSELQTDNSSLAEIDWVKTFILSVRRIRSERDIAPGKKLAVQVKGGSEKEQEWLGLNSHYLLNLARIESITKISEEPDDAVIALAGEMTIVVPLADLIDPLAELAKLEKELNKLENAKQGIENKLANDSFVGKAPEAVVNKERERLLETDEALDKMQAQYARMKNLVK